MSYLDLVKERLHIGISIELRATLKTLREFERTFRERGMYGSGQHLISAADALADGLEQAVMSVLDKLRDESMALPPSAFSELWSAVRSHLEEQIPVHAQRRSHTLKSGFERTGHYKMKADANLSAHFGQRVASLRSLVHHRIEESSKSYNLLALPSRQTTKDLLALIEEVSGLLKSHGDVAEFIRRSAPQLERIETELKRQGLDITFAADALTTGMGDKLTRRNAVSQLIGGMVPNASWDGIKTALTALLPFLSS